MKERTVKTVGLHHRLSTAQPVSKEWEAELRKTIRTHVVERVRKDEVRAQKAALKVRTWFVK